MKRVSLRLPDELYVALITLSEQQERSLHGQILFLLRQATEGPHYAESIPNSPPGDRHREQ
jgi:hypothetical protein